MNCNTTHYRANSSSVPGDPTWNRAAEQAFGWSAEEAIGKPFPFIPPEKMDEHRSMWRQDLEGQGFTGRHITRRRKDGSTIELSVSTAPIRNAEGRVSGIICVYADITAQMRQEATLRERQSAADRQIWQLATLTEELNRQQSLLRLVIDGVPGLVAYIDRHYRYRFINRGYAEWFGRPVTDFVGHTVMESLGEEWFHELRSLLDAGLSGESITFERKVPHGDTLRWVQATYVPDRTADGQIRGVVVLVQDITEQKSAVEALRDSEERFRRIVEVAAEGIWMVDLQMRTTFANPRMADLLGCTPEEMTGKPFLKYLHPEERQRAIEGFRRRRSGETSPKEYRCQRKDGSDVWLDFTAAPMLDNNGELTGVLAMCTDVTERKRTDLQLRQTQKLESLGILAGGIAHDFNNLLVGIMGNAGLAVEYLPPSSAAMGMLRDVIGAAERAAQLTRQLLAYAGKAENATSPTDLSAFVRELGALLRTSIPKLVQITFDLDDQLPPVMVDPAQLQQVVMNLVINAAEAIPEGTPGTVTVSTTVRSLQPDDSRTAVIPIDDASPEYVALTVRDTGSGMDIATQARIFDPFYTTKFAGRGLGLSAVLGIVRGYHGTVTLTSAPGHGTTFTVLLPADRGAVVADESARAKVTVKGHGKILIVDDEGLVLNVARRALEHHGYEVIVAGDGIYAIEQVRKHPELRAVLLDMAMPEMGGDAAAVEIRALRPDLPIILCSGYAERDARERSPGTPFSTFLQKPYSISALLEKMTSVLKQ